MTDLEISKALALAIGWERVETCTSLFADNEDVTEVWVRQKQYGSIWRIFDYREWSVIGPIADHYRMFPEIFGAKWYVREWSDTIADTPQKAIALAVIGANHD